MEDVSDVVGLDTFTNKEIMKKVNSMGNSQFHGYGTDMTKAINHGSQILKVCLSHYYFCRIYQNQKLELAPT